MKKIITISRQYGSGGREVGQKLAERLGYDYYDKEIIEQVHKDTGFSKEFIEKQGEYSPSSSFFTYAFIGRDANGVSMNDYLWNAQREIILKIAESDKPCVIVGRCADYILAERADVLNVFVYAENEFKVKRILEVEEYGEAKEAPEKKLKAMDKKRKINYEYYTDRTWGKCSNYDLALNTGRIGIDKCVDILEDLVKGK